MIFRRSIPLHLAACLACVSTSAAADTDGAKGTLTLQGEDKPLSLVLTHAYYVIGADTFEPKKTTPRLIFTAEDVRAKIEACEDVDCATYAASDGLRLELDPEASPRYWAHVRPMQYSGSIDIADLALATHSPERLAGTLKYRNSGVDVSVTFDATLLKTFPAAK